MSHARALRRCRCCAYAEDQARQQDAAARTADCHLHAARGVRGSQGVLGCACEDQPGLRAAVLAPAQSRQGDGRHGESGCGQVVADRGQRAGAVVHHERGTPHRIADPHGQVEPEQRPVPARGDGRRRTDREGEDPARPQRAVHPGEQRGPFGGQEVPERPETDRQVKGPGKRQGPDVGPHRLASGCARRACASMPALKSTPVTGPWHSELRTRRPAPVPQHTSSPRPNGPGGRNAPAVASSTPSGVRKGVRSNFGASRS